MAGCSDCDQSDICNTCDVADHFSKVGNDCVCDSTYYLNSRNCSLCSGAIQRCSTCDNASTCKTCKSPFKLKNSKLCGCDDGKYINSN